MNRKTPGGMKDEVYLPCPSTGVGIVTNRAYNENGYYEHEHEVEDACFAHKIGENCYVYGVLSSFDGPKASEFCRKQVPLEIAHALPAEVLAGGPNDHALIEELLVRVFAQVEKRFFESLDGAVARRTMMRMQLPEGVAESGEWWLSYRGVFEELQKLDREVRGACCMLVCLLLNGTLYCANAGNCHALLCRVKMSNATDSQASAEQRENSDNSPRPDAASGSPVMRIVRLNAEHSLRNDTERARLASLNVHIEKDAMKLDKRPYTRVIGDFFIKHEYHNVDVLRNAVGEPIICTPEVSRIDLNVETECGFLLLLSDGVARAFSEVLGGAVNRNLVEFVSQEFAAQRTIQSVAQATLDRLARSHHDAFQANISAASLQQRPDVLQPVGSKLDDLVLLVRNVNYPLPQAILPTQTSRTLLNIQNTMARLSPYRGSDTTSNTLIQRGDATVTYDDGDTEEDDDEEEEGPRRSAHTGLTCIDDDDDEDEDDEDEVQKVRRRAEENEATNRPVEPFVDFTELHRAFEALKARNPAEFDTLMRELEIEQRLPVAPNTPSTPTVPLATGDSPSQFVPNSDAEMFV